MNVSSVPCVLNLTAQLFKENEQFVNIFPPHFRCVDMFCSGLYTVAFSENVPLFTQFTTKKKSAALLIA